MKNKKVFGLAVLALILVIVGATNYILSALSARVDLTAEQLYTLSPGSKAVLAKLDQKVTLKFFFSESAKDMPSSLKTYAEQVRDLLGEYERAGNGNVVIETYDPKQDSDEEEWAVKYGVEPQQANPFGAPIYFGLVVTCGTQEQTIPGFDPRMESTLENEITRHITRVAWPERPVVGVLSAIPGVLGEQMNPMMMQMRRRPSPGWVAFSELKKDYDLREIAKDAETIDPDVKALVVIHPKDLSEKTLFAIDQFVIKGGRLIACVDPFSFKDMEASSQQQQNPMMQMGGQGGPSTLGKLFEKWGISFDTSKCVADDKAAVQIRGRNGAVVTDATVLELGKANIAKDVLTAGISQLIIPYAGALEFTPSEGLEFTPILTSSTNNACLVDASMLQMGPEAIRGQIKPDGVRRTLAGRLTGTFKTAFPKGPDWKEGSTNAVPTVVESGKGFVFLFADADFLSNEACVEMVNTLFGQQAVLRGDNLSLFSNIIEQFAGREELIGLRSRGPSDRPFEVVRNLRAEAEKKFRAKAEELQAKLNETSKKLNELLQGKRGTDRQLVSQELESAIGEARREKAKTQKELKNVRKELNADIENLGFRLKVVNICLVPLLVILFGIFRAVLRRKR
ncbi:MAG: Gldg family protein [Kiritimatiellae bacterium]|nr:Gldg family protein [Kiritimatiellia bacterium]